MPNDQETVQSYANLRVNNSEITPWDGTATSYAQWRKEIVGCIEFNNWSPKDAKYQITKSARGRVKNKLEKFSYKTFATHDDLYKALDKAVIGKDLVEKANEILNNLTRAQGQPLDDYANRLEWAKAHCGMTEAIAEQKAIQTFLKGHNYPSMKMYLKCRKYTDFEELTEFAQELLSTMDPRYEQENFGFSTYNDYAMPQPTAQNRKNEWLYTTTAEPMEIDAMKQDMCFYCKKRGHWVRECPEKKNQRGRRGARGSRGRGNQQNQNQSHNSQQNQNEGSSRGYGYQDRGRVNTRGRGRGNKSTRGGNRGGRTNRIQELEQELKELRLEKQIQELRAENQDQGQIETEVTDF